jgi:hypothetical protein
MNKDINFVSRKIKFVSNGDEMAYNPEKHLSTFYQFCQFKNPFTGKYWSRKIIFDERGTVIKTYEKEYNKKKIEEYAKTHRQNKFKMYPTSDIKYVDFPNGNDMTEVESDLLNNTYKEYNNMEVNYS